MTMMDSPASKPATSEQHPRDCTCLERCWPEIIRRSGHVTVTVRFDTLGLSGLRRREAAARAAERLERWDQEHGAYEALRGSDVLREAAQCAEPIQGVRLLKGHGISHEVACRMMGLEETEVPRNVVAHSTAAYEGNRPSSRRQALLLVDSLLTAGYSPEHAAAEAGVDMGVVVMRRSFLERTDRLR